MKTNSKIEELKKQTNIPEGIFDSLLHAHASLCYLRNIIQKFKQINCKETGLVCSICPLNYPLENFFLIAQGKTIINHNQEITPTLCEYLRPLKNTNIPDTLTLAHIQNTKDE